MYRYFKEFTVKFSESAATIKATLLEVNRIFYIL